MEFFLEAKKVVKQYSNHLALDNVNLSVPPNTIFGLLGPNGAGKTTLIRIINQITMPDSGKVLLNGKQLTSNDVARIGYLPEERGLYKKMKVGEQALYLAQLKGLSRNDALKKLKYWFEKFEIQPWWDKKVDELSKGMQQKVQFIVTVLHTPDLLIFDEPFSGFDPINANMLKNEILELKNQGTTILFSTHNMASVEELCDHITLINRSRTLLHGSVYDIRNQFKENLIRIEFKGLAQKFRTALAGKFVLRDLTEGQNYNHATIQIDASDSPNALLQTVLPAVEITGFQELLPSMNEVFIRVVETSNQKQ